jgi:hypothetical protein
MFLAAILLCSTLSLGLWVSPAGAVIPAGAGSPTKNQAPASQSSGSAGQATKGQPYSPSTYSIINCFTNETAVACARLNSAPTCSIMEPACFQAVDALHQGTSYWLDPLMLVICAGNDVACLKSDTDNNWVWDHAGQSPDVPQDEQLPRTAANAPKLPAVQVFNSDGSCSREVGGFKMCHLIDLTNGLEYYAMAVCIAGVLVSTILWVTGSRGQNPGQELTGKRGIILCVTAAFVLGAIPHIATQVANIAHHIGTAGIKSES